MNKLLQKVKYVVDKIIAALVVLSGAIGAFLLSRNAEASTIKTGTAKPAPIATQGTSPKGLANNNPFNLEFRNIGWRGEIGTDGRFSIFDTAENGLRAGMINIHTKMTRDGLNTIRKLISRLSPSFENPTENFIQFVSRKINRAPDQPLQFPVHIIPLSKAIIQFENGEQPFTDAELNEALRETGRV